MLRLIAFLLGVLALGWGMSWLADHPGNLLITWQGREVETSVFTAAWVSVLAIGALFVLWSIFRTIWQSPATLGQYFKKRRQARGLDALSSGMIAISSGDREGATRYAIQARKAMPNEPLTHLLRAQAAQLNDDRATSRRIYEGMLGSRDTETLGLRGLFLEARKEGEGEAARQFAERALGLNANLRWASDALFDMQCKNRDWTSALETLASAKKNGLLEKPTADRRRAVLLTAQAQIAEDDAPDSALTLALEAHGLANGLVPAADIAGRLLASRGSTGKAAKILQKTWKRSPHPDLALTYAYARPGDSPRDRLERVAALAKTTPHTIEAPIALANAAIEARDWDRARKALQPLLDNRLTQRVCTLMARIEGQEHGNTGRVREWLARAINAPRDPAWTADNVVSDQWAPISPVTGELDAFEWRIPVEAIDQSDGALLNQKLEEFVALGTHGDTVIDAPAEVIKDVTTSGAPGAPNTTGTTASNANTTASSAASTAASAAAVAAGSAAAGIGAAAVAGATKSDAESKGMGSGRSAASKAESGSGSSHASVIEDAVIDETNSDGSHSKSTPNAKSRRPAPSTTTARKSSSGESAQKKPTSDRSSTSRKEDVEVLESIDDVKSPAKKDAKPSFIEEATAKDSAKDSGMKVASTSVKTPKVKPKSTASKGVKDKAAKTAKTADEAKIFVPPRAPDDPGTGASDLDRRQSSPLTAIHNRPIKDSA